MASTPIDHLLATFGLQGCQIEFHLQYRKTAIYSICLAVRRLSASQFFCLGVDRCFAKITRVV